MPTSGKTITPQIFAKIDWYSAVFESCSINDILDFLHLPHEVDEFFGNQARRALGYDTQITYSFDGVSIAVSYALVNHFAVDLDSTSVFDFVFDRLRLEISGSGLDSMRDKWVEAGADPGDFDNFLRTACELPRGVMHITRCDFAFDLIDYKPEFIDVIINHLNTITNKRVPIMHLQGGLQFSVRTGDQKTVYLGSPRSDRMLRIYDKRLQLCSPDGFWIKPVDYPDCSSWIRIELQCRNMIAHGLCLGDGDFDSIFRYIYEQYCFRDTCFCAERPKPVKFWDDLFDWQHIPPIVQNLRFAPTVSTLERAEKYIFGTAFRSLCVVIAHYRKSGFLDKVDDHFLSLFENGDDYNCLRKSQSIVTSLHNSAPDKCIANLPGVNISDDSQLSLI